MASEDRELVTEFATLKVGMLVELTGCKHCGKDHRYILTRLTVGQYFVTLGGTLSHGPMWHLEAPHHAPWEPVVTPKMVARRVVFRVPDGLDEEFDRADMRNVENIADLVAQGGSLYAQMVGRTVRP